jgi:CHASE2 domain-containing sensor protein
MKSYRMIVIILYIISILSLSVFIIWQVEFSNLIGFIFLFLASVNLLVIEISKRRNCN